MEQVIVMTPSALAPALRQMLRQELQDFFSNDYSAYTQGVQADKWLNMAEFREYHPEKPAEPTVYAWVSAKKVPFHKKGKKLYFLKSEIDEWLKEGRQKTVAEIQAEADSYLRSKAKGGRA